MKVEDIKFQSAQHVLDEIYNMNVKGGSPFGRAAAWAYKLACEQEALDSFDTLEARMQELSDKLHELKPTMATIRNSSVFARGAFDCAKKSGATLKETKAQIIATCDRIIESSYAAVDALAKNGANLITEGCTVMMHSYSSALMAVFTAAREQGKNFSLICTESRPLRESRLAVKVLRSIGVPVTYITDAEIWEFMPRADLIIMGADSIAWDGSVANKMGTALVSQLALACKKPVYIASELYKVNPATAEGHPIELERRVKEEIVSEGDFDSYEGIDVINQFFDLTPAWQIRGLITEFGVIAPASACVYWQKLEDKIAGNN